MQPNLTPTEYLGKIAESLNFIKAHYLEQMSHEDQLTYAKFDRVFNYIENSYRNGFMNEQQLFSIHGYFNKTVKKFKRQVENRIFHNSTDYDACLLKLQRLNVKLIPLFTELVLPKAKPPRVDFEMLTDANMCHHIFTKAEVCSLAMQLFEHLNFDQVKVPKQQLEALIKEMSLNYNVVAYHNFTHAFQLAQLMFSCYHKSTFKDYCPQVEFFSAIMAGLAHDLNHKGVNNMYKVKKSKKFNILTSETAVLENMHCATFFNIIQLNRNLDIFQHLQSDEERNLAKRIIITCILATDMGKHFKLLAKFQKRVEATISHTNEQRGDELVEFQRLSPEKVEDRMFVLNIMTHACDISNPTMKFQNYMNWSYTLAQEFQDQLPDAEGSRTRSRGNGLPAVQGQGQLLRGTDRFFKKHGAAPLDTDRTAVQRPEIPIGEHIKQFGDFGLITQIMKLHKFLANFCIQKSIPTTHSHQVLIQQLRSQPHSLRFKSLCKAAITLERAQKAEQKYLLHHNLIAHEIKQFLQEKKFEIRFNNHSNVVQLHKEVDQYIFEISIFPRNKAVVNDAPRDQLALHELKDFDQHFEYVKNDRPELRHDEEARVQLMKDIRLDAENPLGIDYEEFLAMQLFVSVQKRAKDEAWLLECQTAMGKTQISRLCVVNHLSFQVEWHKRLAEQVDYMQSEVSTDFIDLSDPLQKHIKEFLESLGFHSRDVYYFELIGIHHAQTLYLAWLEELKQRVLNESL